MRIRERVTVRRKRLPRAWPRYVLAGVLALVLLLALALIPALAARGDLLEGRDLMQGARQAMFSGDPRTAEERFEQAEAAFVRAQDKSRNPLLRLVSFVPLLGRNPDAVAAVAAAGRETAAAGATLAEAVNGLPDGLASLAPRNGRIPIDPYRRLAPSVETAIGLLDRAESTLRGAATSWLLGPIGDAHAQFLEELEPVQRTLRAARLIFSRFPAFLGADGPRRYFFAAQTPAELRGTGGLIGSYSVVTMNEGRATFAGFREIETLPKLSDGTVEPPNPDYARRYPGAEGFMSNVNLTPDFPSTAVAIMRLYQEATGTALDGVIAADPFALQTLMTVTGPVTVPRVGQVDASTVVPVTTNTAYRQLQTSAARARVLGNVAQAVVARFLAGTNPENAAEALASAAGGGHLRLHVRDRELQRGFALADVDGALPPAEGDFLAPIVNNGAGNKVDFFQERSVRYQVQLGAEGSARSKLTLTLHNAAPTSGQPDYVIGPTNAAARGESVSLVSVFLPPDAVVHEAGSGTPSGARGTSHELGHAVLDEELRIPSGETGQLMLSVAVPDAWSGTASHGVYRLTFLGQTTVRPTRLKLEIRTPAGTEIVRTSEAMEVNGGRAVWEGTAPAEQVFEIEFQKPLHARAWDALVRFLSKRLITL